MWIIPVIKCPMMNKKISADDGRQLLYEVSSIIFHNEKTLSVVESVIVGYIL